MDLSPTEAALNAITAIDLYKTDEKYDFKLSDILRRRHRPLLLLLNQSGTLLYSSEPDKPRPNRGRDKNDDELGPEAVAEAIEKAKELFHEQAPATSVVKQLVINKPGERCALVVLENRVYCMRLFRLHTAAEEVNDIYAALVESISKPQVGELDMSKVKGLFRLTKREADVVDALMSGDTDKQIAAKLSVSVETVRAYLKSIRAKLGVQTRTAIVSTVHGLQHNDSGKIG
ncbi:MAG: helix-turn-helix transcriptional regulator [Gammaproteobacteria bacterium]|nr:helix-turn-helix transcriptional regulator [Gammaproteobacteria bacterium]